MPTSRNSRKKKHQIGSILPCLSSTTKPAPLGLPLLNSCCFSVASSTAEQTILVNFFKFFLFEKLNSLGFLGLICKVVLGIGVECKHLKQRVLFFSCRLLIRAPVLPISLNLQWGCKQNVLI